MTRDVIHDLANQDASDTQHRCSYCDRVIPALPDEDLAAGLDVKLGLVSDECAHLQRVHRKPDRNANARSSGISPSETMVAIASASRSSAGAAPPGFESEE